MAKSIRAVDMKSPNGIEATVLLDRAMDISSLTYKNIPISWKSATREVSPIYYESRESEWLRTFCGGLLTTCGLTYFGGPTVDGGEELGLHGRIANLSASNVLADSKWENDEFIMFVQGKVREVKIFNERLELSRKIAIFTDKPMILIEDTVENIGFNLTPLMVLYHMNFGFPILDSTTRLILPKDTITTPKDEIAKLGFKTFKEFCEPDDNYIDQVFVHDILSDETDNCHLALVNQDFNNGEGLGVSLKYNKNNLPYLFEWKHLKSGDYVCGLEPANSLPGGRKIQKEKNNVRFINPGEKVSFSIEVNILRSNEEIDTFIMEMDKMYVCD
jgi:galactose mutarotase-like enzyme